MRNGILGAAAASVMLLMMSSASYAVCVGNCGTTSGPDGDVSAPPGGGAYQFVSTENGLSGVGGLGVGGETNGSTFTTVQFTANAGSKLDFNFLYITSDGTASFTDYSYAKLTNVTTATDIILFTARTNPNAVIVPGFGLPPLAPGVVLNPASVFTIDGETDAPLLLGGSSGDCFQGVGQGCGNSGWVQSTYTIADAGLYTLQFGVTNVGDGAFQSALAFNGVTIDDKPVNPVPGPIAGAGLPALLALGGFVWARRRKSAATA